MPIASHKYLLAVALILAMPLAARAVERNLLAHADEGGQTCWQAQVLPVPDPETPGDVQTIFWVKDFGGDWRSLPDLPGRTVCLASLDGEPVAVMDDGSWFIFSNTPRHGPPLPNGATMRAAASGEHQLWAIGAPFDPASTRPSTAPTASSSPGNASGTPTRQPATAPATKPTSRPLSLYRYAATPGENAGWQINTTLPQEIPDDAALLSMIFVQEKVYVAWHRPDGAVAVVHLSPYEGWSEPTVVSTAGGIGDFKLLNVKDRPELWTVPAANPAATRPVFYPGQIHLGQNFSQVRPLSISGTQQPPGDCVSTVVYSMGRLRLLMVSGEQKFEQAYESDDKPATQLSMVQPPAPDTMPPQSWVIAGALLLAAATAAGLSRRKNLAISPAARPNARLQLAPSLHRLAAGAIDAAPIVVVLYAVLAGEGAPTFSTDKRYAIGLLVLSVLFYLAHTMVAEILCGQSLGKMIVGLQVMGANSQPPTLKALLIRNALRVIDLLVLPLLLILFSQRHQRLGDGVAGTVVVVKELAPPRNDLDES